MLMVKMHYSESTKIVKAIYSLYGQPTKIIKEMKFCSRSELCSATLKKIRLFHIAMFFYGLLDSSTFLHPGFSLTHSNVQVAVVRSFKNRFLNPILGMPGCSIRVISLRK